MTTANRRLPERLTTARLVLRRVGPADVDAIHEYASDPEVTRYMMWLRHPSVEHTRAFMMSRADPWSTGEGEFGWGITLAGTDRVIGMIGIRLNGFKADMGYVLNRRHWGQGIVTEAGRGVVEEAFKDPAIYRVWATCDVENS